MKFCKYEDLERLVRDYSDGMFSLIFPKLNSREKSLKCIERVFTAYIDESPRLKSPRTEEKWLIKRLRKDYPKKPINRGFISGSVTYLLYA